MSLRMQPYECNSLTGICAGGFGGAGGSTSVGYPWAVTGVPYFSGVNLPQGVAPPTVNNSAVPGIVTINIGDVLEDIPGPGQAATQTGAATQQQGARAATQKQTEVPLVWIGLGLLAILILTK